LFASSGTTGEVASIGVDSMFVSGLNEVGPVSFNSARSAFRLVVVGLISR